jgi:hypothetical protein
MVPFPEARAARRYPGQAVWLGLLALWFGISPAAAQTLEGRLLEQGTDRAIELGRLWLLSESGDSIGTTLSDGAGNFSFTAPEPGSFLLAAAALGFRETTVGVFDLGEGGELSLELRLRPAPIEIGGLEVSSTSPLLQRHPLELNGFLQRAQQGLGRFITPADIEKSTALRTVDLLQKTGRIHPSFDAFGEPRLQMMGPRGYCVPRVFVDGIRVSLDFMPIESVAPLSVLQAAEVYRSPAEAPAQYAGGRLSRCGVVVLWTKVGR